MSLSNPYLTLTDELAAQAWRDAWPEVRSRLEGLSLGAAHDLMVSAAEGVLPFGLDEGRS